MAKRGSKRAEWNKAVYRLKEYGIKIRATGKGSYTVDINSELSKLRLLDVKDPVVKAGLQALVNKQRESLSAARRRLQNQLDNAINDFSLFPGQVNRIKERIKKMAEQEQRLKNNNRMGKSSLIQLGEVIGERARGVTKKDILERFRQRGIYIMAAGIYKEGYRQISNEMFDRLAELAGYFGFELTQMLIDATEMARVHKIPSDQVVRDTLRRIQEGVLETLHTWIGRNEEVQNMIHELDGIIDYIMSVERF